MRIDILTLFPEMFEPLKESIIKRAVEKQIIEINLVNIRDFASAEELVVLINLEDTNADLIRQEIPKIERLKILREKAYRQLELLKKNQETIQVLKHNLIEDTSK